MAANKKALAPGQFLEIKLEFQLMQKIKAHVHVEFHERLKQADGQTTALIGKLQPWAQLYELSDQERILRYMKEGKLDFLLKYDGVPNAPLQLVKDTLNTHQDSRGKANWKSYTEEERLEFLYSFMANTGDMKCRTMFGIGMSKLVAMAKTSDEALFRAVLVDSTAVHVSWIAKRIQVAQATQDKQFLGELAKSIATSKERRHRQHDDLRTAIAILHANHGIDNVCDDDLVKLLQTDLKLIGDEGGDSLAAIKWHIMKFKEIQQGKF